MKTSVRLNLRRRLWYSKWADERRQLLSDLKRELLACTSCRCVLCEIVRGTEPASIAWKDDLTTAFIDLR